MSSSFGRKGLTVVCNIQSNLCNLMQRVKFSARVNQSNVNFALLKQLGQPFNKKTSLFKKISSVHLEEATFKAIYCFEATVTAS